MAKLKATLFLAGISVFAMACVPARAEDGGAEASDDGITVIAQRRAERQVDVPMSITALSSEDLAKAGIANTGDLAKATPAVIIPFYGAFMQPSIRGVSSTGANIGDNSNVAMYIDGIYQPQQIATLIDLPDIEQVEILKGPQGALYGQNATGGAILVASKAPSFTPTGKFTASYGNYNDIQLRGFVSGPITDALAVSVAGGFQDRNGFRRHVVTGERDKGLNSKIARGKLLFEPSESVRVTLTGFYSDREDSIAYAGFPLLGNSIGYAPDLTGLLGPVNGPFVPVPESPKVQKKSQFSASPDVYTHTKSHGGSLNIELDLGPGTLRSLTGLTRNKTDYLADADYSAVDLAESYSDLLSARYFTQEINFISNDSGRFEYLFGGLYLKGRETFIYSTFRGIVPSIPPAPDVTLFETFSYGQLRKEVFAVYGELTYDITDQLVLTAGGRYTHEKQHAFSNDRRSATSPVIEYPGGPSTFKKFTPRVTLRYEVSPNSNIYASWGKGFKSGIINTGNFAQDPVDPEVITAYEIGYKGRVSDALTFEAAGFIYDYKGLQVVAYNPPDYIQQNAASARIKGIEANAGVKVTPQFSLSAGMSYLDAKYDKFPAAAVFVPTGIGNRQVTQDLSGKRMQRAPKFTANVSADYRVETSAGELGLFVSVYHNSGSGFEVSNRIRQQKHTLLDGELSYSPSGVEGLRVVLWGRNLTDEAYVGSFLVSQLADGVSYAPPRTFGIRAEYAF